MLESCREPSSQRHHSSLPARSFWLSCLGFSHLLGPFIVLISGVVLVSRDGAATDQGLFFCWTYRLDLVNIFCNFWRLSMCDFFFYHLELKNLNKHSRHSYLPFFSSIGRYSSSRGEVVILEKAEDSLDPFIGTLCHKACACVLSRCFSSLMLLTSR